MPATSDQSPSPNSALLESLPKAIGAIVSLSALGYFIGWRESQSYYVSLGASWAASAVSPLALLQLSATTLVVIATSTFFSLILLFDGRATARRLSIACAVCLAIAALCLVSSQGTFGSISPSPAHALASVGSVFCALSAGITLTELVAHSRESKKEVSSGHLWLVYWFVLPGLFWAPDRLGQARALRDVEPSASALPSVDLGAGTTPNEWRLVQLMGDKALLMSLVSKDKRLFKLIEAKDVKSINSTPSLVPAKP